MSTQFSLSPRFSFGPFEFDENSGELRKHRSRIRLPGQALQILAVLLARTGDVVSRKELQQELWPDAVSGDFEHGLNAAVNKLRIALGDSAEQPRYIETLPGRGYRFIAPVHSPLRPVLEMTARQTPPAPASPAGPPLSSKTEPNHLLRHWRFAFMLVSITAAASILAATLFREPGTLRPNLVQFTVAPPPGFFLEGSGTRQAFAISPDGERLAFTAVDDSGIFRLFLRDLRQLDPRQVPGGIGARTVFWNADGSSLLFTSSGKLRKSSPDAQASQVLADITPGLNYGTLWKREEWLAGSRFVSSVFPDSGGPPQRLKNTYAWAQLLPDRQHILWIRFDPNAGRYRSVISAVSEAGESRELFETDSKVVYVKPGYLLYARSGTLLAQPFDAKALRLTGPALPVASDVCTFLPSGSADFSVSNEGTLVYQPCIPRSQLVWVNRHGEQIGTASPPNIAVKAARLSPDGKRIATSLFDFERGVSDIWLFNSDGTDGRKLALGPGLTHGPVWSPNGASIVYVRSYEHPPRLFLRSVDQPEKETPLPPAAFQMATDYSRDGRFVLYNNTGITQVESEQNGDVWAVDMLGDRKLVPLVRTRFHEANAVFSPDGRWIAFMSNESSRSEIYLQAVDSGESIVVRGPRYLISRHGAQCLRFRGDGKELFYLGYDGNVYATAIGRGSPPIVGPVTRLFAISPEARAAFHAVLGFDVSGDGQRFIVPAVNSAEKPAMVVVQNWTRLLENAH